METGASDFAQSDGKAYKVFKVCIRRNLQQTGRLLFFKGFCVIPMIKEETTESCIPCCTTNYLQQAAFMLSALRQR
jgi:hypothetical protein